jgi:hypothetical protein
MPHLSDILSGFPHTRWHPEVRLLTWHPQGVLDDELADRILEFVELEEHVADGPFHRYADLNGLTHIRLKFGHSFQIAERRRSGYAGQPVKSAFFCDWIIGFGMARLYEELMRDAPIDVRAFRQREEAAQWLDVPVDILLPDSGK